MEDVQRLLHLYKVRNTLISELRGQPGGLKRLRWRLSLGMELVASPSLLIVDGICEGVLLQRCMHAQMWSVAPHLASHTMLQAVLNRIACPVPGLDARQGALMADALQLLTGSGMTIVATSLPE